MRTALLLTATLALAACEGVWDGGDCKDKMSDVRKSFGEPSNITSFDAGGYNSDTWHYRDRNSAVRFTWGDNVDGCDSASISTRGKT